jgi:hypothetical protein
MYGIFTRPPSFLDTGCMQPPGSEFAAWFKGFKLGARCGKIFKQRVSNLEKDTAR